MRTATRRWSWMVVLLLVWTAGCEPDDEPDPEEPPDTGTDPEATEAGLDPRFLVDDACFGLEPADLDPDEVECGMVRVPLDHDVPDGETIDLATVVLSGTDPGGHDQPLLLLGGGPGEALVENALTMPQFRNVFATGSDLIVLDQRGVGNSEPALGCPELSEAQTQEVVVDDLDTALGALTDCRERLVAEGVDLDAFDHWQNARDVDAVRRALGHRQLDVRGGSYGSQLALLAAAANPTGIRTLTLSSPVDPRDNWVEGVAAGLARALEAMADACGGDEECSETVGDLDAALTETTDRLSQRPEEVTVTTPDGEEVTTTYTPETFVGAVTSLFYLGDLALYLPAFVDRARDGDLRPLASIAAILGEEIQDTMSTGMQFSMVCSGEAGLFRAENSLAALESELIERHWFPTSPIGGRPTADACEIWDVEQSYDPGEVTLATDIPTLIVTGRFDHVTPPRLGEQLDQALATSHLVEVPVAGHGPLETLGPCGRQIVGDFLAEPDVRPDDGCATELPARPQSRVPPGLG